MSQNLTNLSKDELKQFLGSFDDILCDCDGVIFISFKPIDGAADALEKLQQLGKRIRYVTNNCSATSKGFAKLLCSYGLKVTSENVIMPTVAIISYLKSINFNKKVYIIGFSAMKEEFINAGFDVASSEPTGDVPEKVETIAAYIRDDLDVGAVVFDYDTNMNFIRIQKAVVYAKRPEVLLIMGNTDMEIPYRPNSTILGPGYFQKALENATGREAIKFGKPGRKLNDYVEDHLKVDPQRTLFIGDSFTDMRFASEGGYQKLLVFTGVVKREQLENCHNSDILPHYYLNSLSAFNQLLSDLN